MVNGQAYIPVFYAKAVCDSEVCHDACRNFVVVCYHCRLSRCLLLCKDTHIYNVTTCTFRPLSQLHVLIIFIFVILLLVISAIVYMVTKSSYHTLLVYVCFVIITETLIINYAFENTTFFILRSGVNTAESSKLINKITDEKILV